MVWPNQPRSLAEIPHLEEGPNGIVGHEAEYGVSPHMEEVICDIVGSESARLGSLTRGDTVKEQLVGTMLIRACVRSANAGRNEVG